MIAPFDADPEYEKVPLVEAPVETGEEAAAVPIHEVRAESHDPELLLELGTSGAEGQELFDLGRTEAATGEFRENFVGRGHLVHVNEDELAEDLALARDREEPGGDVIVHEVVAAGGDHCLEALTIVDLDLEGRVGREGRLHHGDFRLALDERQQPREQVSFGEPLHVGVGPAVPAESHCQLMGLASCHLELVTHDLFSFFLATDSIRTPLLSLAERNSQPTNY